MAEAGDAAKGEAFRPVLSQSPPSAPLFRGAPPTLYRLSFRLTTPLVEVDSNGRLKPLRVVAMK